MWYYKVGNEPIAISSRVRIARNISQYNFPNMMSDKEANELIKNVDNIVKDLNNTKLLKLKDIDDITLNSLVERHLVSKEFITSKENRAIILSEECTLSIMLNEEDHLRIQGFSSGNDIKTAYNNAKEAEEKIGEKLKYSFHDKYGYLTACPTNVGSGIRVSVMLHLPALTKLGYMSKLLSDAGAFGIAIRGLYGERTEAGGYIYQISNQKTMGISDEEIISNVEKIVATIIFQEKKARKILTEDKIKFEDEVMRTLGILKYARKIDTKEAEENISLVRLGIERHVITDINIDKLQKISVNIYPNMLKLELKKDMDENTRDEMRAKYIREELK